jgi:hypothetical protein
VKVDQDTAALVAEAQDGLNKVQAGGDAIWKATQRELDDCIAAGRPILLAAQKAIDALAHCEEWVAYQSAMAALALAKQVGEHALDVTAGALTVAKDVDVGVLDAAETLFKDATLLQVTSVNLSGSLKEIKSGGNFSAIIQLKLKNKALDPIQISSFNLKSTGTMIVAVFERLLDELKKHL